MDEAGALAFGDGIGQDAVGMMISSHSNTPLEVRRTAERRCVEVARK
jgi:hypothetical protein